MPHILECTSLDFAGGERQSWMLAFQGLHAGQFIGTHRLFVRGFREYIHGGESGDRQGTYRSVPIYRGLTAGESKQAAPKYYRAK